MRLGDPVSAPRHLFQDDTPNDIPHLPLTSTLSETQSKHTRPICGLMCPTGPALVHPAAPLLLDYAHKGCPTKTGPDWDLELLDKAVRRGAHPSAKEPLAAEALQTETMGKVDEGFAQLIPWRVLRERLPPKLKISLIAAIPHKSRLFRSILALSYGFWLHQNDHPSANDSTTDTSAPVHSMSELGKVLPRIIHALASVPDEPMPFLFAKLNIKDGFWRMAVPADDEFNFCYVMPTLPGATATETMIVVPPSLQMGWKHSPPFFCAASEAGRNVGQHLLHQDIGSLPRINLSHKCWDPWTSPSSAPSRRTLTPGPTPTCPSAPTNYRPCSRHTRRTSSSSWKSTLTIVHSDGLDVLRHATRAMLHGIHSVFPPSANPVLYKKLLAGDGVWAVRKEILGWMISSCSAKRPVARPTSVNSSLTSPPTLAFATHASAAPVASGSVAARTFTRLYGAWPGLPTSLPALSRDPTPRGTSP
jgi:hypothetical protein